VGRLTPKCLSMILLPSSCFEKNNMIFLESFFENLIMGTYSTPPN